MFRPAHISDPRDGKSLALQNRRRYAFSQVRMALHQPGGRQDIAHPGVIVVKDVVVDLHNVDVGDPGDISNRWPIAIIGPRGIVGIVKIGEREGAAIDDGRIA